MVNIIKSINILNWDNVPIVKVSEKELKMIKEADESGICNIKEKEEIMNFLGLN